MPQAIELNCNTFYYTLYSLAIQNLYPACLANILNFFIIPQSIYFYKKIQFIILS